jgi:hypothetical protein
MRISAFAWVCVLCGCSTPDLVYQASADGAPPDATVSDSSPPGDSGATQDSADASDTGAGDVTSPSDSGVDAPADAAVDAPPDATRNTCPTPPSNYKCCPGPNSAIACLASCDPKKCQTCADTGCVGDRVCCTAGGPNTPPKCIRFDETCN